MTLESTIQQFGARLRDFIRRRVAVNAVDDIYANILLKLAARPGQLDNVEQVQAWLFRIANNAVIDYYRKQAVEKKALEDFSLAGSDEHTSEQITTEEENDSSSMEELSHCIAPLLAELPQPYHDAVLMTDLQGLTQSEAAEQAGLSLAGMKSRVQRGRQKLKEALMRCCALELNRRGDILDYRLKTAGNGCPANCK